MEEFLKWKTQIRKGYLDLCILMIIEHRGRVYGFDLVERLKGLELEVKEGTLYPLLNRLSAEGLLKSEWEFKDNNKGHPRKFYSLTKKGQTLYQEMQEEFEHMHMVLRKVAKNDSKLRA